MHSQKCDACTVEQQILNNMLLCIVTDVQTFGKHLNQELHRDSSQGVWSTPLTGTEIKGVNDDDDNKN